ncbi:MAG: nitrous oxide reductase accessory protein NosL [Flavobacteriales bacterium]|nr:nitrous oxide reductase accessory protein NosL [Flavobacteriales bacterium]
MDLFDNRFDSKFILNQKETVFCSIECLVKYVQKEKIEQAQFFVSNYEQPNKFLDAQKASFLISKKITSPMGAHLAAFSNAETAKKMAGKRTGNVYSWSELHDVLLTK